MINGIPVNQVYLVSGVTDMRKATPGLSLLVSEQLEHDPFDGSVCPASTILSGLTTITMAG